MFKTKFKGLSVIAVGLLVGCSQDQKITTQPPDQTSVIVSTQTIAREAPNPDAWLAVNKNRPLFVDVRVINGASWIEIDVDGENRFKGMQKPGWNQRFEGDLEINMRVGSEANVEVSVQGGVYTRLGVKQGASGLHKFSK